MFSRCWGGKESFYRAIDRLFTLPSELPGQLFTGKPLTGFVLRHEEIMAGGELTFEMTNLRP